MALTFEKLNSKLLQTSYLLEVFWYSLSKIGPRGKKSLFNSDSFIKVCFGLDLVTLVKGTIHVQYVPDRAIKEKENK